MDWQALAVILVVGLFILLVIGQWTAFALGSVGMVLMVLSRGVYSLDSVGSVVWNLTNNYVLTAVPLFIFMGEIVLRSGISDRFYRGVAAALTWLPGSLLHANIAASAIFSAISGSSVATAASIGTVAIPELRARGYDERIVFGSLAAGGTLGILIPPSIVLILYGALVEESVPRLFMAGLLPGIGLALLFSLYIGVRVALNKSLAPPSAVAHMSFAQRMEHVWHLVPVVALMAVVLGGIYTGIFTPTESAAVGAAGALLLAASHRALSRAMFTDSLYSTVRTSCMILFIIVGAQILVLGLTYADISRQLSGFIVDAELSKWVLFGALVVLYIFLGFFVDGVSMLYITLPVLLPVVQAAGFDLIWFGIVLTILIELGQITPPIGLNLFTIQAISGGRPIGMVIQGSTPFVFIMLAMVLLLAVFPQIALWLAT
jgi:tripartite ATP-independent transporter DctM subunit